MYRLLFDQVFRRIDPERAHHVGFRVVRLVAAVPGLRELVARRTRPAGPPLAVMGLEVPAPFGLAAGFDKDARGIRGLAMLGFGFVEVGTVTAHPQPGNDRPRLWRHVEQRAVRNRMGFNNQGAVAVAARLRRVRAAAWSRGVVVGVNIGKSKVTPVEDAIGDYATSARLLAPLADYLVVNVSSPNTPGLRSLQAVDQLRPVLAAVQAASAEVGAAPPLLVKIAPDLSDDDVDAVADLAAELGLAGVVAVNTTIAHDLGEGGLSGPPLLGRGLAVVRRLRERLPADAVVIGVGGVTTPDDALAYREAGADLVQGYTGFVYEGPFWAARVNRALAGRWAMAGRSR
ncbi:quinone-dependent dihydroorotate dehydrogenase [Actinotalea ferrariae]|uniref:quinone-dependent dihydroorotate dehydrogenase n=1 Tax=Actinotalea ferrariae TaxID=1386098 RepID=UPI001C8BC6CC|nr:quinone-dependent dihydroorotate dehydrogenase [Actinotalea ferrariae]MBX9246912.1 quinone-dependent dihydroorotate dehydrogenase [Actinotalea ferrariae]